VIESIQLCDLCRMLLLSAIIVDHVEVVIIFLFALYVFICDVGCGCSVRAAAEV